VVLTYNGLGNILRYSLSARVSLAVHLRTAYYIQRCACAVLRGCSRIALLTGEVSWENRSRERCSCRVILKRNAGEYAPRDDRIQWASHHLSTLSSFPDGYAGSLTWLYEEIPLSLLTVKPSIHSVYDSH